MMIVSQSPLTVSCTPLHLPPPPPSSHCTIAPTSTAAAQTVGRFLGTFTIVDGATSSGRPVFMNDHHEMHLYWVPWLGDTGWWEVGPTIGSDIGMLTYKEGSGYMPDQLPNAWRYWNGASWIDGGVSITCSLYVTPPGPLHPPPSPSLPPAPPAPPWPNCLITGVPSVQSYVAGRYNLNPSVHIDGSPVFEHDLNSKRNHAAEQRYLYVAVLASGVHIWAVGPSIASTSVNLMGSGYVSGYFPDESNWRYWNGDNWMVGNLSVSCSFTRAPPPLLPQPDLPPSSSPPPRVPLPYLPLSSTPPPALQQPDLPPSSSPPPRVPLPCLPLSSTPPPTVQQPDLPPSSSPPPKVPLPYLPLSSTPPPTLQQPDLPPSSSPPPTVPDQSLIPPPPLVYDSASPCPPHSRHPTPLSPHPEPPSMTALNQGDETVKSISPSFYVWVVVGALGLASIVLLTG